MRLIALFLTLTSLILAEGFPRIFNSAGDDIYENMQKYLQIKDLSIYADRPEVLESFCQDANASLARGYTLDKMQEDPEASIDKQLIKSYAKELRRLSSQNESIQYRLKEDIEKLFEAKDFKSLAVFKEAKIKLSTKIIKAIEIDAKKQQQAKDLEIVRAKAKVVAVPIAVSTQIKVVEETQHKPATQEPELVSPVLEKKPVLVVNEVPAAKKEIAQAKVVDKPAVKVIPTLPKDVTLVSPVLETQAVSAVQEMLTAVEKKNLTKLEYYEQSMLQLKEELYELRESGDELNMNCLNDITAINYWMISMLKNDKDACTRRDAIKQMKSYDKSSLNSCGRDSMRYIEWHGRIKPHVGGELFKAEADCHQ